MDYLNKLRGLLANDALLLAEDIERQAAQGMVQVSAENGYAETVDPDTADPVLGEKTCQQCESAWVDASTGLVATCVQCNTHYVCQDEGVWFQREGTLPRGPPPPEGTEAWRSATGGSQGKADSRSFHQRKPPGAEEEEGRRRRRRRRGGRHYRSNVVTHIASSYTCPAQPR